MNTRFAVSITAVLIGAANSLAQSAILFDIGDTTLAPGESTTITMLAAYPPSDYAMGALLTDLLTSVGSTGFSDLMLVDPMDGPGTTVGTPTDAGFEGIIAGQIFFPPIGFPIGGDNPIAFWQATYTAPADVATPFDLLLETRTDRFDVYINFDGDVESRLDGLVEGSATIRVIPAPAGALVLGLGLCALRRRTRV